MPSSENSYSKGQEVFSLCHSGSSQEPCAAQSGAAQKLTMLLCELGQRDMLSRCPCLLLPGDIINRGSTTSINDPRSIMDKAGTD